jgi:hypothetical protein
MLVMVLTQVNVQDGKLVGDTEKLRGITRRCNDRAGDG